jgi:tetratricopeptide (TPR) repeat protein
MKMSLQIKKIFIIIISIGYLNITHTLRAEESFDPFSLIRSTPEGKQLLDIAINAEFDAQLAKRQLDALSDTGIEDLGLEYKVANILAYIATYHGLSEYEKVARYVNELHLIGVKKGNNWVLGKFFDQQGLLSLRQGRFLKGLEDVNKAIEIGNSLNYQELVALATAKRAIMHSRRGQSSQSLKDFSDALYYFEKKQNVIKASAIYSNLVVLYIDRKEYDKGLEASDKSLEVQALLKRKSHRMVAINYLNRAIILGMLDKKNEELDAFTKAQDFAIRSNDIGLLSSVYANLSDFFLRNENYQLSIERATKCIETAEKINDIYSEAVCYLNKGLSFIYTEKVEQGFALLKKAEKITEAEQMESTLLDVYLSFVEGYQVIGDHEEANKWLEKRYQILLKQAKNDKENYFHEIEENFKENVSEREQVHTSFKSDMMESILGQEALVKKLAISLAALFILLLVTFGYILRLRSKLKHKKTLNNM